MNVSLLGGISRFLLPSRGAWNVADSRRERLEDWIEALHRFIGTADHHAIAAIDAPDAAAGAHIHVVDALRLERLRAANVILPHGIAAVDDAVARFKLFGQRHHGFLSRIAGRNHHPDRARLIELLDEIVERAAW